MPISTPAAGAACNPLTGADLQAARNNIALIDRGVCGFAVKAKNAQNAGAIGVIIANNAAGLAPGLGGTDATITIPTVSLSLTDANLLRTKLTTRSRTSSGVVASLGVSSTLRAGADQFNRAYMFAPNPFQSGSSVSHFDTSAFRNLLMEPAINGDLTHSLLPPEDLTYMLLLDIGW
jgi:hypothetical protein